LIYRLFVLQIVRGEDYETSYTMKAEKTVTVNGTRGNIYDRNGELLAYSELAYSVVIEDCGYYSSTKIKNEALNSIIDKMVTIIEENGDSIDYNFPMEYANGRYNFTVSDNALLRFLRDIYGHAKISQLTDSERNATAEDVVELLKTRYGINQPSKDGKLTGMQYDAETVLKIIFIRYNLAANSYKRYISFTVATNVSSNTMASILENSDILTGVTIEEDYIRKYNYSTYIAHIVGYTGKINDSELQELQAADPSYEATDIVGKAGIEAAYETLLAGKKGYKTMLVDNVGRVLEVIDTEDATVGSDIYLSIDVKMQERLYNLLERRLAEILVSRMVDSDNNRVEENIVIPVSEVCAALINNNKINMDLIAASDTPAATATYNTFSAYRSNILTLLENELLGTTPQNSLTPELKECILLIRSLLLENEILNSDKITSSDPLQKNWNSGNISFREYLEGAIEKDWVNIYNLDVSTEYPASDEVISSIIKEAIALISSDRDFDKMLYSNLIMSHAVSNKNVCLILMEQGGIDYTESEYVTILNGGSVYNFLISKIKALEITPAELALDPCSGSCVMEDPNTGNIIAMVSYPSYDINYFSGSINSEYYAKLLDDDSTPLVNRVTQTKIAPGSTFKPLMAIAALNEGVLNPYELIDCDGIYDTVVPHIKCAIYPNEHGQQDLKLATANSCNDYFCELGYRLCFQSDGTLNFNYGLSRIQKYAQLLGLSTKTGIQIPETTPHVTDYNPVASAIGQGTNAYTSLNLARYTSTIANKGTVYNSSIIYKTVNGITGEETVYEPVVDHTVDIDSSIWTYVSDGMNEVVNQVYKPITTGIPAKLFAKSGTAEEDKNRANHACFVLFSRDENDNAEVVVTAMLPYAYAAANAGIMTYYAMCAYYDVEPPSEMYHIYDLGFKIVE
ncbi:MAG: penicillin-binding transpeptidase domain-containing protein, partial [Butyrivibrio sp.]